MADLREQLIAAGTCVGCMTRSAISGAVLCRVCSARSHGADVRVGTAMRSEIKRMLNGGSWLEGESLFYKTIEEKSHE